MRLQLTKRTDYAIRACLFLASADRCPISSRRIAEQMDIPDRFLPQVMGDLTRGGIVRATNGKNGGYCLHRDPASISLLELVELVEGTGGRQRSALREESCDETAEGAVHATWSKAQSAFTDVLAAASLADLVARRPVAQEQIGRTGPERTGS